MKVMRELNCVLSVIFPLAHQAVDGPKLSPRAHDVVGPQLEELVGQWVVKTFVHRKNVQPLQNADSLATIEGGEGFVSNGSTPLLLLCSKMKRNSNGRHCFRDGILGQCVSACESEDVKEEAYQQAV
jgi:hypothetical protein